MPLVNNYNSVLNFVTLSRANLQDFAWWISDWSLAPFDVRKGLVLIRDEGPFLGLVSLLDEPLEKSWNETMALKVSLFVKEKFESKNI